MRDAPRRPLLEAAGISKRFGAVRALDDVSLSVAAGEVHGLLGANGAGKSTLIGILAGAVKPDGGELRVAGETAPLGSLSAARAAGLTVVHQELMLFPDRTVEENVFASVLPQGAGSIQTRDNGADVVLAFGDFSLLAARRRALTRRFRLLCSLETFRVLEWD